MWKESWERTGFKWKYKQYRSLSFNFVGFNWVLYKKLSCCWDRSGIKTLRCARIPKIMFCNSQVQLAVSQQSFKVNWSFCISLVKVLWHNVLTLSQWWGTQNSMGKHPKEKIHWELFSKGQLLPKNLSPTVCERQSVANNRNQDNATHLAEKKTTTIQQLQ